MERADTEIWEYPDSLDALVAAPEFHHLLFENDDVRVLETRIGPGETVPLHTHRWPSVLYVLSAAHHVRRDDRGNVLSDTRTTGAPPRIGRDHVDHRATSPRRGERRWLGDSSAQRGAEARLSTADPSEWLGQTRSTYAQGRASNGSGERP